MLHSRLEECREHARAGGRIDGGPGLLPEARSRLSAKSVSLALGGQRILNEVSCDLREGQVILLEGENGAGKTTLLNVLSGNIAPDEGTLIFAAGARQHTFTFPGRPLFSMWKSGFDAGSVARLGVGRLWQDTRLFGSLSVIENLMVARNRQRGEHFVGALTRPVASVRAAVDLALEAREFLAVFGLSGICDARANSISLGQAKRVAIARALFGGASTLLLDEPLAGLDHRGVDDVLAVLEKVVGDHRVAMLVVEHAFNQAHLDGLVDCKWHLERGCLFVGDGRRAASPKSLGFDRSWIEALVPGNAQERIERLPNGAFLSRFRPTHSPAEERPLLAARELVVARGDRDVIGFDRSGVVTGFDIEIYPGEIVILHAPNGWGKTTLLKGLAGLLPAKSGNVRIGEESLDRRAPWARRAAGLELVPSDRNVVEALTVREQLRVARANSVAIGLLPKAILDRRVSALSGGQKQLLALACSLSDPAAQVRMYDEPFSMLDRATVDRVLPLLRPDPRSAVLIAVPSMLENF